LSSLKWVGGAFGFIALGFGVGWFWPDPTRITYLSVGQGDCSVFQHQGVTVLIDTGPKNPKIDAGEKIVVPKLRQMGVNGVDLILLSHPDMDHIGGTGSILKAYPDAMVAVSHCFRDNKQLLRLLRDSGRNPDAIEWLGPELRGHIGDFTIQIDCPQTDPDEETNDGSMLVHIADGAATAMFTGDAPAKIEEAFDHAIDVRAELLKVGHHGSRFSTCEDWLKMVHPQYAIVSCGINNEYHHPHPSVVNRLKSDGIKICRTDLEGDVVFELSDGHFVRK
jgi:beta-lactamase superfamily II metal-dependent hydrolase